MPITNPVTWDPTDTSDQRLKEAFDHLDASIDGAIFYSEPGVPDRFTLNSRGCFGIQTYVITGREFPKSADEFSKTVLKSCFQALEAAYPQLYDQTQHVVTQIGSACSEFSMKNLQGLAVESSAMVRYCDSTVELLAEAEEINLRYQLDIMLSSKYKSADDLDNSYKDAKEAAMMTLSMLMDDAQEKALENQRWSNEFSRFKANNARLQQDSHNVVRQYMEGLGAADSVFALLDIDSNKLLGVFSDALHAAKDRHNPWSKTESNPVTMLQCSLGCFYIAQRASEDPALRKAYGDFEARITALQRDRPEVARLVMMVARLSLLEDMNDDMDSAYAALQGLNGFYTIQRSRFEMIQQKMNELHQRVDNVFLDARQKWVLMEIDVIVQKLRQLKAVARDYQKLLNSETRLD